MELVINRKSNEWMELLRTRLQGMMESVPAASSAEIGEEAEGTACERFAYRRTLLFYTESCACCRYAKRVKNENGEKTYVCSREPEGRDAC